MYRKIIGLFMVLTLLTGMSAPAMAQEDEECTEEDCTACRTTNFYYVLIAAIIIFAVFFIWTNRNKVPKEPAETEGKQGEKTE